MPSSILSQPIEKDRDNGWYSHPIKPSCPHCGGSIITELRTWFGIGFSVGYRSCMRRTMEMSPYVNKFIEMLTWIAIQEE